MEQEMLLNTIRVMAWERAGIRPKLSKHLFFKRSGSGWFLSYMSVEGAEGDALRAFCDFVNREHKDLMPRLEA